LGFAVIRLSFATCFGTIHSLAQFIEMIHFDPFMKEIDDIGIKLNN